MEEWNDSPPLKTDVITLNERSENFMDCAKLFKLWYSFSVMVAILSGICMVIGLIKNIETLTYMPLLAFVIVIFATVIRDLIADIISQH